MVNCFPLCLLEGDQGVLPVHFINSGACSIREVIWFYQLIRNLTFGAFSPLSELINERRICSDEGLTLETLETSVFESLRWTIHIINPADKNKLSCNTPHRPSCSVSFIFVSLLRHAPRN